MGKFTREQIEQAFNEAKRLRLWNAELLADFDRAAEVCNGIGADWMPAIMRDLADALSPVMVLPSMIHDIEYHIGGDDHDRLSADVTFHTNVLFCIDERYGWYNPLRYIMRYRAGRYYDYLRAFGGLAFNRKGETK